MAEELITTTKVMELLGMSKAQVYKLLKAGEISAIDIAKPNAQRPRYRFHSESVYKFAKRRKIN